MRAFGRFLTLSILSTLFFLVIYLIVRVIFPDQIIFSQGNYVCLGVFVLELIVILIAYKFALNRNLDEFMEKILPSLLMSLILNYSFILTVPTTIDRSITVFILGDIDSFGGKNARAISENFKSVYIDEDLQINRRIQEQLALGNLERSISIPNQYELTSKGKLIVSLNKFFASVFNISPFYATGGKTGKP
jgi:hypothetical protein